MKRTSYIRPMIAGLSLVMASGVALAQTAAATSDANASNKPQSTQTAQGKDGHDRKGADQRQHGKRGDHGKQRGSMLALPAPVLAQLNLSEAQKAKYFDAQTQTQAIKQNLRQEGKQDRTEKREQANKKFDPKQMFEQQNQRFEKMQTARLNIQKQWLGFWDSLSDAQKDVIQKHVQSRGQRGHDHQPKQG